MNKRSEFDDLRPYYDEEIPLAMQRLGANDLLYKIAPYIYPDKSIEEMRTLLGQITNIYEFQHTVMRAFSERVIKSTIHHFTFSGFDKLLHGRSYLFLSNHRDIVLDSALLQYALYLEGFPTTEISFGSNLMLSPFIIDIGRSNKMYKVVRGGSRMDLYNNSLHLSNYIRYTIGEKNESLWIAQRNGRTKDGIDRTDVGIINMFSMSKRDDMLHSISALHIVPVSISYEWEPCDLLKALELYRSQDKLYVKAPGEDLNSILTGITQFKGNVHIAVGTELTEDTLLPYASLNHGEFIKQVAIDVDKQVIANYRYSANNYIAADMLLGTKKYASFYTDEQKAGFETYLDKSLVPIKEAKDKVRQLMLGIYAGRLFQVDHRFTAK